MTELNTPKFHRATHDDCIRYSVWADETCMLLGLSWYFQNMWTISDLDRPSRVYGKTQCQVCFALGTEFKLCPNCDVIGGIELFWNRVFPQ